MLPTLQIGPLAIQFPGLLLLLGVWIGVSVAERVWGNEDLIGLKLADLVFFSLLAGIVGARLGYVLRYLSLYLEAPLSVFSLNPNTLSAAEGLLAASLVGWVYGQRNGLPLWPTLDALTPGFAVFAVGLGAAHLASGDAFGAPSSVPWAIELWGALRHPTQIYEIILAGAAAAWALLARRRERFDGFLFLSWLGLTAAARLFLEGFRGDSVIVLGAFRGAQILSWFVLLATLLALHLRAVAARSVDHG